jgi:hypothetical protein
MREVLPSREDDAPSKPNIRMRILLLRNSIPRQRVDLHDKTFMYEHASGLENWQYGRWDPLRWQRDTLYPQQLALTSPTNGGLSIGIVRFRTKATE